ncbi:hypothetical protein FB45DRAFT_749998, partial [Roridomyces roridus]
GDGAPDGHPYELRKDHNGRCNLEQRQPHRSKDMNNVEQYNAMVEAFTDIFELVRDALKEYLPDEYDQLSIYMEHLPLDASSPCYPLGGFVLNVRVCTWAHQDGGDNLLCFVIPFGNFTGGGLCHYETGFCFGLKQGDVHAFPSCDITHFNLHFKGLRGGLVLHSDRYGESWVRDCNGWSASVVRYS